MKKKLFFALPVIAILVVCGAFLANHTTAGNVFRRAGEFYGQSVSSSGLEKKTSSDQKSIIKGNDFAISEKQFENLVQQNMVSGLSKEEACMATLDQLIISRCLYYAACEAGYKISEKDAEAKMAFDREAFQHAENYSDFQAYLEGTGLSEDAYWESMTETYIRTETTGAFIQAIREQFTSEHPNADEASWEAYAMELTKQAVEKQMLVFGDGYSWTLTQDNFSAGVNWGTIA